MPSVETKYFGTLAYQEESAFDFPQGLPAFEEEKRFVLIQPPQGAPLVFLQSLARSGLCFLAFPVLAVDKDYQLAMAPEEVEDLGLDAVRPPAVGADVMALAVISLRDEFQPTANLMAPIILNVKNRRGLQAIRRDARYSHAHAVALPLAYQSTGAPQAGSRAEEAC